MSGEYNFDHIYGDTLNRTITWKDSSNVAINLTGYTARMQIRTPQGELILTLSTTDSSIVLGGSAGTIQLVAAATTMQFATTLYLYDLVLTSGSGVKTTILAGRFTLNQKVTQG
jgi:hypothetical protein